MREIKKQGNGCQYIQVENTNPPITSQDATKRWHRFGRHKARINALLLAEQFSLCCYSELRADEENIGYHIEHVENKRQNPPRTFDYTNLAASALTSDDLGVLKTNGHEAFAGHAPGKTGAQGPVDMNRFISPHQLDCRRFFSYLSDGRIVPADNLDATEEDRANYTIIILNLNSPFLITLRKKWWEELDDLFDQHVRNQWNLSDLVAVDLVPTAGKLSRFFSLTRQFFGSTAEQVIADQAPALL